MQKSKIELKAEGMLWLFYMRFALLIFPIAIIIISIYWICITSSSIWINAVGANILISNIFSTIFAIVSFVLILLCVIGKLIDNIFIPQLFFVSTVLCFVLSFITLSLSTDQSSNKYISDITDYCNRNIRLLTDPKSICFSSNSGWQISNYVYKRTLKSYDIYVGILAPYVIIFAVFIISCMAIPSNKNHLPMSQMNHQLTPSDSSNDYIQIEDEHSTLNNDQENLINTNNSQQIHPQTNEERLNINLPEDEAEAEYEYVSEEEEDQNDNINVTVKPNNSDRPDTNSNTHTFIRLSDSA